MVSAATTPVEFAGSATFDAAGVATVQLATARPFGAITVQRVAVSTTSALRTTAKVYRTFVSPGTLIDVADLSGNGDSSDTVWTIQAGEGIVVQWTDGTPGATATATASGQQSSY